MKLKRAPARRTRRNYPTGLWALLRQATSGRNCIFGIRKRRASSTERRIGTCLRSYKQKTCSERRAPASSSRDYSMEHRHELQRDSAKSPLSCRGYRPGEKVQCYRLCREIFLKTSFAFDGENRRKRQLLKRDSPRCIVAWAALAHPSVSACRRCAATVYRDCGPTADTEYAHGNLSAFESSPSMMPTAGDWLLRYAGWAVCLSRYRRVRTPYEPRTGV